MKVQIKVNINKDLKGLDPAIFEKGVMAVYDFLREYHKQFNWRGENWFGGAGSGDFANKVVEGWQPPQKRGSRWIITNTFGLLDWKVKGGKISAHRGRFLTIPLVPGSKRIPARDFEDPLFKAGNALCRKVGNRIEAVYALRKSVDQAPWPDAMPSESQINDVFVNAIIEALGDMS